MELSNTLAERSVKPFGMGCKYFLFANTPGGAHDSAVLHSLMETAKVSELDPYRYLVSVMTVVPMLDLSDERKVAQLLPEVAPLECKTMEN